MSKEVDKVDIPQPKPTTEGTQSKKPMFSAEMVALARQAHKMGEAHVMPFQMRNDSRQQRQLNIYQLALYQHDPKLVPELNDAMHSHLVADFLLNYHNAELFFDWDTNTAATTEWVTRQNKRKQLLSPGQLQDVLSNARASNGISHAGFASMEMDLIKNGFYTPPE